ncbi:unnamed protein product [Paramecium sonneborni]|uniref:Uncharacterized protein n=1 Tax=Paramecium sonneborni TaxID=65129 RepID=A0A8S1P299_9CILI|nr:unnamed protein product [Paramecium sonneborni]
MTLEQALSEDREYLRLQKLTEALKLITNEMPYMKSFNQVSTIKYLLCAYPFNPISVELVITSLIDHFQDEQFIYTFFSAIMELASIQEMNNILGHRRSKVMDSFSLIKSSNVPHQVGQRYCRAVYENILEAKKFACQYLKQLFDSAIQFQQDIQYFSIVFKLMIKNSSNTEFIHFVIQKYEECKTELFGNHKWIDDLDDEIIEYFEQSQIPMPFAVNKGQEEQRQDIKVNTIQINDLQNKVENSDSDSSFLDEVDLMKKEFETLQVNIQKWLCIIGTPSIKSRIEYISDEHHFEYLMSFIFNPLKHETIKDWEDKFNNLQVDVEQTDYKIESQLPSKFQLIRSYKTTLIFLTDENFQSMIQIVPKLIPILLYQIKISLEEKSKSVNLLHISCILDKFLQKYPKSTLLLMTEMNLFQILGKYIYNNKLATILVDILDIQIDRYFIGALYQEQLWRYFLKINWFETVSTLLLNNNQQFQILEIKENQKFTQILRSFAQSEKEKTPPIIDCDEKKKLTDFLGTLQAGKTMEEYYNSNQLNWQINQNLREHLLYSEIEIQDIDGLKKFVKERDSNHQRSLHRIKTSQMIKTIKVINQIKRKPSEVMRFIQINKPILRGFHGHRRNCESIDFQSDTIREDENNYGEFKLHNSNPGSFRASQQNSEDGEDDLGSLSPRKLKIYPGYKLHLYVSEFEKNENKFKINKLYSQEAIQLLKFQINSFFNFLDLQHTNKIKVEQQKIDIKPIINSLLTFQIIMKLHQFFLYGILKEETSLEFQLAEECGIIVNQIYKYSLLYQELLEIKPILEEIFLQAAEYLCKLIVKTYQTSNQDQISANRKIQTFLLLTFKQGYQVFHFDHHTKEDYGVHKFFHSTVIHIIIYWFFNSQNNNLYQNVFLKFITLVLANAPPVILSSILFRLGLIGLLFDTYNIYCLNGSEHVLLADGLLAHVKCIVYSINASITYRQLTTIQLNLKCLDSWKKLADVNFKGELSIYKDINFIINPNFNFKHSKINFYSSQMSIENNNEQNNTPKLSRVKNQYNSQKIKGNYKIQNKLPLLNPINEKQKVLSKTFSQNIKR